MSYTYQDYQKMYNEKKATLQECLDLVKSGDVVFTTNNYTEPNVFLAHIHEIADRVENVKVWKGRSGLYPFMTDPAMKGHIEMYTYFFGPTFYNQSQPLGLVELVPTDLHGYYTNAVASHPANICVCAASTMDENGILHMGMNHVADGLSIINAIEEGKTLIVEVNPNLHYARGAVEIPITSVTKILEVDTPEFVTPNITPTAIEDQIGAAVAELVSNGDTIQLGIGGIPNAVGFYLKDKKDLGLHSEMFTTSMMELINAGVITGAKKTYDVGKHVFSFAEGLPELYSFIQNNPDCIMRTSHDLVDPFNIARQDNMVSINTIIEMDLTGQICAESVGPRQISGSGGAFCFAYGSYRSKGGKGILAFPTRTGKGQSKIKPMLTPGAVVTTPRNYADIIVTEYGVARLRGATVKERAEQLIAIAHPDDREELRRAAKELKYI